MALLFNYGLLAFVAIFGFAEPQLMQNSNPILWRKSEKDIIDGFKEVVLTFGLLNPCSSEFISLKNIHKDMLQTARENCEQKYKILFLDEMRKLCPSASSHLLRKRELGTIALGVGAAVGVVGVIGLLAGGLAVWNRVDIEMLKKKSNEQLAMIKQNREVIDELRRKFSDMMDKMQEHQKDFDEMKNKSITTNYAISTIVSILVDQRTEIRKAAREWKNEIVSDFILDMFNITLPCFPKCTLKNAKPKSCFISDDNQILSMRFYAPMLNEDLVLLHPDPFKLLVKGDNMTCSATFTGIKNVLLSQKKKCVYGTNFAESYEGNMLVFPGKTCLPFETLQQQSQSKYYEREECQDGEGSDNDYSHSLIQTKLEGHNIHIYCPGSLITINGRNMECPDYVFVLPFDSNFTINGVSYMVDTLQIVRDVSLVPAYSLIANTHLGKSINWTELKMDVIPMITAEPIPPMFDGFPDIPGLLKGLIFPGVTTVGLILGLVVFIKYIFPVIIRCRRSSRSRCRGAKNGFPGVVNFNVASEQTRATPSFFSTVPQMSSAPVFNVNEAFGSLNFFKKM